MKKKIEKRSKKSLRRSLVCVEMLARNRGRTLEAAEMEKKRLCFELDAADHAIKALHVDKANVARRLGAQRRRMDELDATDSARTVTIEYLYRRVNELGVERAVLWQDADNAEVRRMEAAEAFEQLEQKSESYLEIISSKCDQIANLQSTNTRWRVAAERKRKVWEGRADKYERNALALRSNESRLLKGREEAGLTIAQKSNRIIELAALCNRLRDTIDAAADVKRIMYAPIGNINHAASPQTEAFEDPESPEAKKEGKANCNRSRLRLLCQAIANFARPDCWVGGHSNRQPGGSDYR